MVDYFDKHADEKARKRLKSAAQKRVYLEKKGFKIQKDGATGVSFMTCKIPGIREQGFVTTTQYSMNLFLFHFWTDEAVPERTLSYCIAIVSVIVVIFIINIF